MKRLVAALFLGSVLLSAAPAVLAQAETTGIDPEAIIERMLAVERQQAAALDNVVLEAEYLEGEEEENGEFVEKVRFDKRVYIRYLEDTAWYHEEYLAYYKDGRAQDSKDLAKEAAKRKEKKRKRKARDISFPMLAPFYPENRDQYEIVYQGINAEEIESYVCHRFTVTAKVEEAEQINGDFFVEADSFHLVRVDFSPAKLVKKTMFKLKQLNMSVVYGPTPDGFWLPRRFDIEGKGKAAFFFGVKFAGTEYYRNPTVNADISDEIFEVTDDD